MPIMAIYRSTDISPEVYRAFRARLPLTAAPEGALVHANAQQGSGFITVEVWEDREALQGFLDDVLSPAVSAMGLPLVLPEILDVDDFIVTAGVHGREIPYGVLTPA